ncbi:MAG: hypothetical protein U1F43_10545 [Myxococcota bacterium]
MIDRRYQWQGVARDGLAVTTAAHEAVARAGAWIERSDQYSNLSLCLLLGMRVDDVADVARALAAVPGFEPNAATRVSLEALARGGATASQLVPETPAAPEACAARPCQLVTGRPFAPEGGDGEVFATLALTFPRGDGELARAQPR